MQNKSIKNGFVCQWNKCRRIQKSGGRCQEAKQEKAIDEGKNDLPRHGGEISSELEVMSFDCEDAFG
jgi:hypothetical protein